MIKQYYTLLQLSKELDSKLKGYVVFEAYSQEKNSVVISLYHPQNQDSTNIFISVDSVYGTFFLDPNLSRKRSNVTDVFPVLMQKEFQFCTVIPQERILNIYFTNYRVECVFFGGANGTIGVYSPENTLVEGLKLPTETQMRSFERKSLESFYQSEKEVKISKALSNSEFVFASYYIDELANRCAVNTSQIINSLTLEEFETLKSTSLEFQKEILESTIFSIVKNENEKILTLVPLNNFPTVEKSFDSISEATRTIRWTRMYETEISALQTTVGNYLQRTLTKNTSILTKISNDFHDSDKIALDTMYADILYSQPKGTQIDSNPFVVHHWDDVTYSIPVDVQLTVSENAQLYRAKALKKVKAKEKLEQRRETIRREIQKTQDLIERFKNIQTLKELSKFAETLGMQREKGQKETISKFREFPLQNSYKIYIGKGASNNDELTFRFAKPNDIWLHARSVSGSHGVIKTNTKQAVMPNKEVLEEAAALVAYYSKSRNGTMVPVSYTFKKYVRKKKGFADGAVIMDREEVVFVEPKKPIENT
jgi:predicted ribosome quality control (RQC) complex YloA/Tae2 family protein